jgi:hypothetical protein
VTTRELANARGTIVGTAKDVIPAVGVRVPVYRYAVHLARRGAANPLLIGGICLSLLCAGAASLIVLRRIRGASGGRRLRGAPASNG